MDLIRRLWRDVFTASGALWQRPSFWLMAGVVVLPFGILLLTLRLRPVRSLLARLREAKDVTMTRTSRPRLQSAGARLGLRYHMVTAGGLALALVLGASTELAIGTMRGLYLGGLVTAAGITLGVVWSMGRRLRGLAASARALEHEAHHDSLTGLPNRTLFNSLLDRSIDAASASGQRFGLLLLDLDRFKDINDSIGHVAGDALLVEMAPRLWGAVRKSDTVARLGGDEFAVLLPGVADLQDCASVAERVRDAVHGAFDIAGHPAHVSASIGIAMFPEHGADAQTMLQHADMAMYAAKASARRIVVYDLAMQRQSSRRQTAESRLRRAIAAGDLSLEYQPIVDLATGRLTTVEARVSWTDPQHGPIGPEELMTLAERMHAVLDLTLWGLDAAVRQTLRWREVGVEIGLAVNVPARALQDRRFPQCVAEILRRSGLPAAQLTLEITGRGHEADLGTTREVLVRLRALGVTLCLGHFGSEVSGLAHLTDLPVQEIKISRELVLRMLADGRTAVVVESMVRLARCLGLAATAEGVDTHPLREALGTLGCQRAQGGAISPPCAPDELERWIAAASWTDPVPAPGPTTVQETRGLALTR